MGIGASRAIIDGMYPVHGAELESPRLGPAAIAESAVKVDSGASFMKEINNKGKFLSSEVC